MARYIDLDRAIHEIRAHQGRIGTDNDFYQLAHDHIIRVLEKMEIINPEESNICGYRAKDLAIITERLKEDDIKPIVLKANNEAFMDGYKMAYEEAQRSIQESVDKMLSNLGEIE